VVVHVDPFADVASVAVEGNRQPIQEIGDEQRDHLLRELVGTVVVTAARDADIEPMGPEIG
jgi:hypothetical protein